MKNFNPYSAPGAFARSQMIVVHVSTRVNDLETLEVSDILQALDNHMRARHTGHTTHAENDITIVSVPYAVHHTDFNYFVACVQAVADELSQDTITIQHSTQYAEIHSHAYEARVNDSISA